MADTLRPRLDRLQELSKTLNSSIDEAGKIVQGVESFLSDIIHLGITGGVLIDSEDLPEIGYYSSTSLIYGRYGPKFRIFVTVSVDDQGREDRPKETLWANCSRDLKLQTFNKLPALLDKLIENLESTLAQVTDNTELIQAFLPPAKEKGAKS